MKRSRYKRLEVYGFIMMLALTGCSMSGSTSVSQVETLSEEVESDAAVTANEVLQENEQEGSYHGRITGELADDLTQEQKKIILDYMELYYRSVGNFQIEELSELFTENAEENIALNRSAWEYMIGLRQMQKSDLTLQGYWYELNTELVEPTENAVSVQLREHSTLNFTQHADVNSELFHVLHTFVLEPTEEGIRIRSHIQRDGSYRNIMGDYWRADLSEIPDVEQYFANRRDALLEEAREQQMLREVSAGATEVPEYEHGYDRAAAVSYAGTWVGRRNPQWADYSGNGGNCQNYTSQSLVAGGIPMFTSGPYQWKWLDEAEGTEASDSGWTVNWLNVNEFYRYLRTERDYGIVADPDASFFDGEPGDLVRMGFPEVWNHVVVIADVVRDEAGNPIDYLIHSNTSDMKQFPLGAYPIPCQSLMKIYGWN